MFNYKKRLIQMFPNLFSLDTYELDKEKFRRLKEVNVVEYLIFLCPFATLGELSRRVGYTTQATISHLIKDEGVSDREFDKLKAYIKFTTSKKLIHFKNDKNKAESLDTSLSKAKTKIESLERENELLRKLVEQQLDLLNKRKDFFLKGVDYIIKQSLYELGKEVK